MLYLDQYWSLRLPTTVPVQSSIIDSDWPGRW